MWLADDPTHNQNHAGQICVTASQPLLIHLSLSVRWFGKSIHEQRESTKHACVYTSHTPAHSLTCLENVCVCVCVCVYLEHKPIFFNNRFTSIYTIVVWVLFFCLFVCLFVCFSKISYPFPQKKKSGMLPSSLPFFRRSLS